MNEIKTLNYFLQPGYVYFTENSTCISTVLGSSVSVCLYDKKKCFGGMNHFLFPFTMSQNTATTLYGNISTVSLIRLLNENGSNNKNIEAQIYGGAHNKEISEKDIGKENYEIAKKILYKFGIEIISEDIGGKIGRKIVFNTTTNEIIVIKVEKLRRVDWYPYQNDR